jgi:hypothetical protein
MSSSNPAAGFSDRTGPVAGAGFDDACTEEVGGNFIRMPCVALPL